MSNPFLPQYLFLHEDGLVEVRQQFVDEDNEAAANGILQVIRFNDGEFQVWDDALPGFVSFDEVIV